METKDREDFFHEQGYSLRAISPEWIDNRAKELAVENGLSEPDAEGALNEVLDRLLERTGRNFNDSLNPVVYISEDPKDPYILAIPLHNVSTAKKPKADAPKMQFAPNPNTKRSSLRTEFEDVVFEIEPGLTKSDLARDFNDNYLNARVNALWDGFRLYHNKFTKANDITYRENYNKTLGRYVIAKVGNNGVALFNRAPFRHLTMALAMSEAGRLAAEFNDGFAVFRCIDIVGKPQGDLR
jgi:hypothetical protein